MQQRLHVEDSDVGAIAINTMRSIPASQQLTIRNNMHDMD